MSSNTTSSSMSQPGANRPSFRISFNKSYIRQIASILGFIGKGLSHLLNIFFMKCNNLNCLYNIKIYNN